MRVHLRARRRFEQAGGLIAGKNVGEELPAAVRAFRSQWKIIQAGRDELHHSLRVHEAKYLDFFNGRARAISARIVIGLSIDDLLSFGADGSRFLIAGPLIYDANNLPDARRSSNDAQ